MKINLVRNTYTDRSTIGALSVDGKYVCDVLEDMVRQPGVKIYGKTAIPPGAYKVRITYSPRFKRYLPLLLDVPNYEGIRIHTGNDDSNTEGCLITGTAGDQADWVSGSVVAFNKLIPLIEAGEKTPEGVTLVIEDTFGVDKRAAPAKARK